MIQEGKKVILFDGVCNLCNNAVNFIIKHDKKDSFRYASLQSKIGKQLIAEGNIDTSRLDSILLITPKKGYFHKSTAALHIARQLSGGYPLLFVFLVLPKFIRDRIYDTIAKNRYKWFGKKESCMIPTPELKNLFIDQ
ncbi:thiol-disulfide oxidoreductase DCC family protein [Aquimarina sp. 2201CG5-10]|uniref:thiol-disulfide oxidoreductase DCC family protein n=1 Tax=Aquimarina callyspongiae TaxID=3098150 RepID=UPI002AB3F975|nr:thiol-disulfide oxidoreductase DCC family protein [Aquimarina sp. 2201CG5-10]MDY8135794.1 thiol-disulfide oxidoreductase DCC family protein [Aquimarina sp. 2201CG5-10]